MKATTRTLVDIRRYAQSLMKEHGLSHIRFRWTASRTIAGACIYAYAGQPGYLELSRTLAVNMTDEALTDTILHEIAHHLAGPLVADHGKEWTRVALRIGGLGAAEVHFDHYRDIARSASQLNRFVRANRSTTA